MSQSYEDGVAEAFSKAASGKDATDMDQVLNPRRPATQARGDEAMSGEEFFAEVFARGESGQDAAPDAQDQDQGADPGQGQEGQAAPTDLKDLAPPSGVEVDPGLFDGFKGVAAKAGVSPEAAKALTDWYTAEEAKRWEADRAAAEKDLRNAWGQDFEANRASVNRTIKALDAEMGGKLLPVVRSGLGNSAAFGELMLLVARKVRR